MPTTSPESVAMPSPARGCFEAVADAERHLAREAARRPDLAERIEGWRARVAQIPNRLEATTARMAFVGAMKSGKSTLVDALLGRDLLPRGSGVLTAQATEVVGASEGAVHWPAAGTDTSMKSRTTASRPTSPR